MYMLGVPVLRQYLTEWSELVYDGMRGNGLYGHSDSSWADNPDDLHSTSGYVFLLTDAAISWYSRKQWTAA